MNKKYELLKNDYIGLYGDKKLYRIISLKDFSDVKKGDKGGYIESENNLSQQGDCWVYDNARILGTSNISENAKIYNNVIALNNCYLFGQCEIRDNAQIIDNCSISGNAKISGKATIAGNAIIEGNSEINGCVFIGHGEVICNDAYIVDNIDHMFISDTNGNITFFKTKNNGVYVVYTNHFNGTLEKFENELSSIYKNDKYLKNYLSLISLVKNYFNIKENK